MVNILDSTVKKLGGVQVEVVITPVPSRQIGYLI